MPRDGALILSDVHGPTIAIVCEPCGLRGTYGLARLIEQHGGAKLTAESVSISDRCKAVYDEL